MRFVAIGDSYTIGTSVSEVQRWPNQLVERIPGLDLVANLAVDGATTADLIAGQLPVLPEHQPELVTVLVGVNDVVRGTSDTDYAANVAIILDRLCEFVGPERIVAIAIPDYTVTPRGTDYGDPDQRSDAILRCNAILRESCEQRGVRFVPEVFEISRSTGRRRAGVAADGLHPAGDQYRRWVDVIEPAVRGLLDS